VGKIPEKSPIVQRQVGMERPVPVKSKLEVGTVVRLKLGQWPKILDFELARTIEREAARVQEPMQTIAVPP
jgi:hypothetical protein